MDLEWMVCGDPGVQVNDILEEGRGAKKGKECKEGKEGEQEGRKVRMSLCE